MALDAILVRTADPLNQDQEIAADLIAVLQGKVELLKLVYGDEGSGTMVSTDNPLPVEIIGAVNGLTDAQMRASAVPVTLGGTQPVSGSVTATISGTPAVTAVVTGGAAAGAAAHSTPVGMGLRASTSVPSTTGIDDGDAVRAWGTTTGATVVAPLLCATAVLTTITGTAVSQTMLAANTARRGATMQNEATEQCFIKYGSAASDTSFTYKVPAGGWWEMPPTIVYTGIITIIWAVASGNGYVTELSA